MTSQDRQAAARRLQRSADRLDELAEVAELMDDDGGAAELRARGHRCRMQAMRLLDG